MCPLIGTNDGSGVGVEVALNWYEGSHAHVSSHDMHNDFIAGTEFQIYEQRRDVRTVDR
jgi:hypothetical protein